MTAKENNELSRTGVYHTGSVSWPNPVGTELKRAAVAATNAAEATVTGCQIADFEEAALAAAFTSNPNREDAVNSMLNTAGNVVE